MLYAVSDLRSFVVLVVAFVVSATVAGWVSAWATARAGLRQPGRSRLDPRRQLEPYGCIGAAISGVGWARPVEVPENRRGGRVALAVLAGPLVVLVLGLGALAGLAAADDLHSLPGSASVLQNGVQGPFGQSAWFLAALMATWVGVLSLVPLPPLPGGWALFAVAPRTLGWQRARYQLIDRNIGTAVVLALLLIPLGGSQAVLPTVLGHLVEPLVRAVTGG